MTDTLIDRADSGEIPRIDDLGEGPTTDLRQHLRRDTREELTQNLGHEIAGLPPRRRPESDPTIETRIVEHPILNTWDMDETVIYLPTVADSLAGASATVTGDLQGPQSPPPPLPKPPRPAAPGRAAFTVRGMFSQGRHRAPAPLWTRVSIAVGTALVLGSTLGLGVLAVIR